MSFDRIIKIAVFLFAFTLLTGIIFWGMQWFSGSLKDFFSIQVANKNKAFLGSVSNSVVASGSESSSHTDADDKDRQEKLEVNANSAIIIADNLIGSKKIVFGKDEEIIFPIASLTKLMTAVVVLENYDLSKKITINQAAVDQEGEQGSLVIGQSLSVRDLLYITLVESSNDSAYALAQDIGVEKFISLMNIKARDLGLKKTYFSDATGLDAGSFSTVSDLASLAAYLIKNYPSDINITSIKEFDIYSDAGVLHHKLQNTNQLLGVIPNIIAGKTGWTIPAKGCFLIVQKDPRKDFFRISAVLGAEDRFAEIEKMVTWADSFSAY